ncbi:MAG: hypothetical protein WDO74_34960 [Pseudomonadota bacterium]
MISDQTACSPISFDCSAFTATWSAVPRKPLATQMHPLEFLRLLLEDEALFRKDRVAKTLATRAGFRNQAAIEDWDATYDTRHRQSQAQRARYARVLHRKGESIAVR